MPRPRTKRRPKPHPPRATHDLGRLRQGLIDWAAEANWQMKSYSNPVEGGDRPTPGELDYLVDRLAVIARPGASPSVISVVEYDRQHRARVAEITRPKPGPTEPRIQDALSAKLLRDRPDALLEKAFGVFEPRGLWLRLRALEPYDATRDDSRRRELERSRREVSQALTQLKKFRVPTAVRPGFFDVYDGPQSRKHNFEDCLGELEEQLMDADETVGHELISLEWRRRQGFPEDTPKLGLFHRRRLVFYPVIAALMSADERYWKPWERRINLIIRSSEFWFEDPCPKTSNEFRDKHAKGKLITKLSGDYYGYTVEELIARLLATATSPMTIKNLQQLCLTSKGTPTNTTTLIEAVTALVAYGRARVDEDGYSIARD